MTFGKVTRWDKDAFLRRKRINNRDKRQMADYLHAGLNMGKPREELLEELAQKYERSTRQIERYVADTEARAAEEWEEFIDLIEWFNDSLSRIGIKDWVVWNFHDAPWPIFDVPSTDKHPAELDAESVYGGLKVGLKIEKKDESRFRRLLLHLKRRYPEFKKFEEWKNRFGVLIKECQDIARDIWLAAEDSKDGTGMRMAQPLLAVPPIREGLYHVPKFTYDFAVDNYRKNIRPVFQVVKHDDRLYKLVPEDDPDYDPENGLAIGSQEAIERCKAATIKLCEWYSRDQRIGEIKEKEKQVKDQATIFQGILSTILADLAQ